MIRAVPGRRGRQESPRDRLLAAIDAAMAARTMPPRRRLLRWDVAAPAFVAAVDEGTWLRHVRVAWRADRAARAQLIESYLPNARSLAKRAFRQREPLEDLVQVAAEALVLAIDRFDPERRKPFLGFANLTITGTLKRHYRDVGWGVRVPRRVHDRIAVIRHGAEILHEDLGRPATAGEIADLLDLDEHDVAEVVLATAQREAASLDADTASEPAAATDGDFAGVEDRVTLDRLLATLDPDQHWILRRYFFDRRTQSEIGRELGVSQMHVSRTLARTVRQLGARV